MWVSQPIYESLPFFYLAAGMISPMAAICLNYWYWPTICLVVGFATLLGELLLLLKRWSFRHQDHRTARTSEE